MLVYAWTHLWVFPSLAPSVRWKGKSKYFEFGSILNSNRRGIGWMYRNNLRAQYFYDLKWICSCRAKLRSEFQTSTHESFLDSQKSCSFFIEVVETKRVLSKLVWTTNPACCNVRYIHLLFKLQFLIANIETPRNTSWLQLLNRMIMKIPDDDKDRFWKEDSINPFWI